MKQNHFYMPYFGNKRNEVIKIYNELNLNNKEIDTIIEPYCGSCAISYYISSLHPKKYNYVLNDNNQYLKMMYEIILDDEKTFKFETEINNIIDNIKKKDDYDSIVRKKNFFIGWLIGNKYFKIRPYMFPQDKLKHIKLSDYKIYDFFRNEKIKFTCDDAIKCYEEYKDNEKNLLIFDPPYLSLCNDFYQNNKSNIYEYLFINDFKKNKADIFLILENIWIIKLLFKTNEESFIEYDKKYQTTKKNTKHIIIKKN